MKKIQATIGILLIIGLSLGIGFGFCQTYDGKNLRDLAGRNAELRARVVSAENAAAAALQQGREDRERFLQQAREDRERLALYIDYIVGQVEAR
jgi:hypothetical protein